MKRFKVVWNETYLCEREILAESEEEALEIVQNDEMDGTEPPDKMEFGGYDFWEVEQNDG